MNRSLNGQIVLITGAARGIGAEVARMAAARGAKLSLVGLEPERLEALASELGPDHAWFPCDVTDQASLDAAVAGTLARFGGIDVVLANAGVASNGTVAATPAEAMVRTVDVNLNGVIRTVSATLPTITERQGYYMIVSSAAALAACPGLAAYAASKIGVEHFASALRIELAAKGVAVGVAHPSWIDTDLVRDQRAEVAAFNDMLARMPWPFNTVIPVETCAKALVGAMERRARKVFVPEALAVMEAVRPFFVGDFWEKRAAKDMGRLIERLEADVMALGRAFGSRSAGFGEAAQGPEASPTKDSA
jgi:NAD(P)-dependent dehydrogenase (short-subunit alcohol dehydrogenase family)